MALRSVKLCNHCFKVHRRDRIVQYVKGLPCKCPIKRCQHGSYQLVDVWPDTS